MKKSLFFLFVGLGLMALSACSSVPKAAQENEMSRLGPRLLESRPEALAVAIRHDARLKLEGKALPVLKIRMEPEKTGAFESIRENMALVPLPQEAQALGLPQAADGQAWTVFGLSEADAIRADAIRELVKRRLREREAGGPGGSLQLGLEVGSPDSGEALPVSENSPLELRLRVAAHEDFLRVWSGSLAELKRLAQRAEH